MLARILSRYLAALMRVRPRWLAPQQRHDRRSGEKDTPAKPAAAQTPGSDPVSDGAFGATKDPGYLGCGKHFDRHCALALTMDRLTVGVRWSSGPFIGLQ